MFRISKLADYSVIILSYMAEKPDQIMSATAVAEVSKVPEPTVSKILKLLSKTNIIESKRGINGGYLLTKNKDDITVEDIVATIDGPVCITQCANGAVGEGCIVGEACSMKGCWQSVNSAIREALSSVSLADMMRGGGVDSGKEKISLIANDQ